MISSKFGKNLIIKISGESHSPFMLLEVKNLPCGLEVNLPLMTEFLKRRKADGIFSTSRTEDDIPEIISGVTDGFTDGKPLVIKFLNENINDDDYENVKVVPRPSQSDYVSYVRFGRIFSGGGHYSGRLTLPLCAIGFILKSHLAKQGIYIGSHISSIGKIQDTPFDKVNLSARDFPVGNFPVINYLKGEQMKNAVNKAKFSFNSLGGTVECGIVGLPVSVGEPNFYGIENIISSYVFSIPAVKGIEFGNGFESTRLLGSDNNDEFIYSPSGEIKTVTNNSGGINAGMSNGMPIIFKVAIKPTASIGKTQKSVNLIKKENCKTVVNGRHDPCILSRVTPIIESATAIAIYELYCDYLNRQENIDVLRNKINVLNGQILDLFEERLSLAKRIGEIKKQQNLPITDEKREKAILKFVEETGKNENAQANKELFEKIMELSKKEEQ